MLSFYINASFTVMIVTLQNIYLFSNIR